MDSIKSGRRATRLARMQDYLSQRRQHKPESDSHDSGNGGQKVSQPLPALWGDPASFLHKRQKKQSNESPQALTYHEIPLLTLDWNSDKAHRRGSAHVGDIWNGTAKMTLSRAAVENIEDPPSVNDMWEAFLNGTDDIAGTETSVCDAWQAFLNGPSCTNRSGVRESEWLQTAASVSPSNDNGAKTKYAASSQEQESQVGADTPTTLHGQTSAACQPLPETSPANVALNTADHQPAEACVSSPRDDNTTTRDAFQRSETNSVTDTPQEFSLEGATPVSKGSVDSSAECHKQATWERERDGIIESAEGIGQDEPFTPSTADFVTSSGELETTDMTAEPESQNASTVDRISQGARLAEGLSSSGEGQGTGTSHNATDDTLAFRGTIRQGTKDGERFVFSTSRQGAEEGMAKGCTENEVVTGEEIFRPQETEECEISQRYADGKHREEFRLNRNSENPLEENESGEDETRPAQSHADEFNPDQTCDETFERSQTMARKFKLGESENDDAAWQKEGLEVFREAQVDTSCCATSEETTRLIGAEVGITQVLNEDAWQRNDRTHDEQTRSVQAGEVGDSVGQKSETGEHALASDQTEEGKCSSSERIIEERQEINLPTKTRIRYDHDTSPTDKCNPHPVEKAEMRQTHSQDNLKDQREDAGHEISPEEVTAKETGAKRNTSTDLQRRAETLERIEEDMSQRDKDERVSIGKLKIEAPGELMGNVGNPQGERRSAPAQLKEQELSAEVESSPRVECKKLSEGTKDPLTAENTAPLQVIESGVEETFVERFGEDLVRRIWEEVFDLKAQASDRDANFDDGMVGELVDTADITLDRHLPFEKDSDDAFDSGVFSLTELPPDPNSSLCRGLEQTIATESNEYSPNEKSQSLYTIEQTHLLPESQADSDSSAPLSQDLILAAGRRLTESAQSSPSDQGNCAQIKAPSVTRQGTGRQIEESAVAHKERFNQSVPRERSPSETLKESDSLVWWSVLYILSHVIRLLICALLVAGFFLVVFMWDFPAFSALYGFSLSWWFYKWKRHRVMGNKGMVG